MGDTQIGAVLVAAGRGTRMQSGAPKQFQDLAGRKLVLYSLHTMWSSPLVDYIVVVVPEGWESAMRALCAEERMDPQHVRVVVGGRTRQDSVRRGLGALPACSHVIVHDAARPFVSQAQIAAVLGAARVHGAATTALPVTDTLMRVRQTPGGAAQVEPVDRQGVWAVQTPQAFERRLLDHAHAHAHAHTSGSQATDDGSLVLALGRRLEVVAGSWWNIKITSPEDFGRAHAILAAGVCEKDGEP